MFKKLKTCRTKDEEETLDCLTCALSGGNHFSKDPIILSACSHSVCKSCLIKEDKKQIKCGRCGIVTRKDLRNDKESIQTRKLICSSLSDLYTEVEERMSELLDRVTGAALGRNDRISTHIKNIEEQVGSRIESIKSQLDNIHDKIKNDLKIIKEDLLDSENEIIQRKLNELRNDIQKEENQNEAMFYEYQDHYLKLNKKLKQLENYSDLPKFKPSIALIDAKSLIGELNYVNTLKDIKEMNNLRSELLKYDGCNTSKATFRYTLNGLSKFKESKDVRCSTACNIRDLEWTIWLQNTNIERDDNKSLSFVVYCESDKHLDKNANIRAHVEYRLLHHSDTEKYFVNEGCSRHFSINGDGWGYRGFINYKELMNPEKGFYDAIDDSITVEVAINTEGDVNDTS